MGLKHYHKGKHFYLFDSIKQSRGPYLSHANIEVTFRLQIQTSKVTEIRKVCAMIQNLNM